MARDSLRAAATPVVADARYGDFSLMWIASDCRPNNERYSAKKKIDGPSAASRLRGWVILFQ
jgi:hypothetical protein